MSLALASIRGEALRALIPPPRLALSEWIERHLMLPQEVSALPGRVRLYPFQRGIADAISDPAIERVTLVKPVRVGFTTLLTAALGSFVVNDPSPVIALLPTESDCRDHVVSDIEPTFQATPVLRGALSAEVDEAGRNTLLHRRFVGGSLKVVAAKAPRNLRRHTARILFVDEADAMAITAEGPVLPLAERRTMSFADRKIVVGSTPLDVMTSPILRLYEQSDRRVYEVPCPECGAYTEILWSHIEWPEDRPHEAAFRCPQCQSLVPERQKTGMVAGGRWRATVPGVSGHAGFRLNALVSPLSNASWGRLAEEFLRARNDTAELRVFVNTILGQGWEDAGSEVDETELATRVEAFGLDRIPVEVLSITAGVDVQSDRLEVSFVGWAGRDALVLDHHVLWGSPQEDATWMELDEALRSRWRHPLGGMIGIDAAMVDTGGHWTDQVYSFCFPRSRRRIFAGKGVEGSRPVFQPSKSKVRGGRLFLAGVDVIKTMIFERLARGRSIRFSDALDQGYFEQLASERLVLRYIRGQPVRRFERRTGARAEALDCLVYAWSAHAGAPVNEAARENELRAVPQKAPPRGGGGGDWIGATPEGWI